MCGGRWGGNQNGLGKGGNSLGQMGMCLQFKGESRTGELHKPWDQEEYKWRQEVGRGLNPGNTPTFTIWEEEEPVKELRRNSQEDVRVQLLRNEVKKGLC